jgi:hypothetical protein
LKKEVYHLEEAAIQGDTAARCELGQLEKERGHYDRAKKHMILSASAGCVGSSNPVLKKFLMVWDIFI